MNVTKCHKNVTQPENPTFIVTGNIVGGLPDFDLPPFGINQTYTIANPTIGQVQMFFRLLN